MTGSPKDDPTIVGKSQERSAQPSIELGVDPLENPSESDLIQESVSVSMSSTKSFSAERLPSEIPNLPGRLNDRYDYRKILGQGGFGLVYEAWDEVLHRTVAIKLARRDRFDGTKGRERFLEEARAAAKLKHPHIVTVFDSGTDADGNPFVVFEYIAGESLSARIKRQPMTRDESLAVMISVAEAVHAAHKVGLVHRDLKPANILLDANGQAHVTDFGLAVDENSQREQAGEVAGTLPYMSPEQVRGETQYVDGRTDIWSLGIILYELLVQRRPFSGRDRREVKDEILHREPKPLRQIDDTISPELERVCLRCLKKPISERFSSAADLAKDLRASQLRPGSGGRMGWIWPMIGVPIAALLIWGVIKFGNLSQTPDAGGSQIAASPHQLPDAATESDRPRLPTPPPRPQAGKWFSLLQRPPEVLLWPGDTRNSRWDLDSENDELWVQCNNPGLIKLGEVKDGDYKIQMSLFQTPWVGNVGLFIGGHSVKVDGINCRRYQLIELHCAAERLSKKAYVHRALLDVDEQSNVRSSRTLVGALLPTLPLREQSLRLIVEKHRLKSVEWADVKLPELVATTVDSSFESADLYGDFGIFVISANGVFRRPELLLIQGTP